MKINRICALKEGVGEEEEGEEEDKAEGGGQDFVKRKTNFS